ncbi:MAG: hypothetical protein KF784_14920 [Fimbriimonadaceae bacterium]|nr:hypothetical protein [Fimbriimonadaceae bacterium]
MPSNLLCMRCNVELQRFGTVDITPLGVSEKPPSHYKAFMTDYAHRFICPECGHIELFHPRIGQEERYGYKVFEPEKTIEEMGGWVCSCGFVNEAAATTCTNCSEPWDPDRAGSFDP